MATALHTPAPTAPPRRLLSRIALLALVFALGYAFASVQKAPDPQTAESVPTEHEDWHGNVMRSAPAR